jgi:MFS family permease
VYPAWRIAVLGLMALLMLLPVTLPVPVLRELVAERFGVSELLTSAFMSINMVGAVLAAPLAGALADRFGRRPLLISAALALDALCFLGLTRDVAFPVFLAIRFVEGAAHIFALSLLLGLASGARPEAQRGLVMGATGSGLLLGVACGAPLGGRIGEADPLVPLYVGAVVVAFAAVLAALLLRETEGREAERPGLGEIARLVRASPIVAIPLAFSFADRFSVGFFTSTFPLFLRGVHELPPTRIGLLIAIFMLPFAALSFPFGILSQRTSRALLMCGGSFVYGCLVASLGFWPTGGLVALMLVTGTAAAVMFVPSLLLTAEALPDSVRTTAMGAFNAAGSLGFIVGPLTGGLVSQSVAGWYGWPAGYAAAFVVAGGFEILLGAATYGVMRRFERKR